MKKLIIFIGAFFVSYINTDAFGAKIAEWQDTRRYISKEEWATPTYNNFVHLITTTLEQRVFDCTAQYVAPNIIVSAGHCVKQNAEYTIDRFDREGIPVKLLDYEYVMNGNVRKDWALFLVENPEFYKEDVFDVKIAKYDTEDILVRNAGWGSTKILDKKDLDRMRQDAAKYTNFREVLDNNYLSTFKNAEEQDKLKASDFCHILNKATNRDVYEDEIAVTIDGDEYLDESLGLKNKGDAFFPVDCVVVAGNSGGAIVQKDGKELYGVVSYNVSNVWFYHRGAVNVMASSTQFLDKLESFKNQYPSNMRNTENIAHMHGSDPIEILSNLNKPQNPQNVNAVARNIPAPSLNLSAITVSENPGISDSKETIVKMPEVTNKESESNMIQQIQGVATIIEEVKKETEFVCDDAEKKFNDIFAMNDYELTMYINNAVYCQERKETLEKLRKAYDDARSKEQSKENRMLTAATTAATGLGGMELARGFSEQQADKNARNDMLGYVSTFRCEYGKGNNVMGGPDEIQLPVIDLTANKTKYKELAASIKVRKEALGMKPGLESEEILEKTTLYDEENTGITGSSLDEGSIYRAEILGIASDQEKIKSSSEASERRVKGGATSLGGGIVGGITGNSAINGKIGEKIKEIKDKKSDKK